jgi:hypothetical protein
MTPAAFQWTALEEYRCADARTIVNRIFANIKNCTGKHPVHCTNNPVGSQECEEKEENSL